MHANEWYELVLLELSGMDPVVERLREAEAVHMPEPEIVDPAVDDVETPGC